MDVRTVRSRAFAKTKSGLADLGWMILGLTMMGVVVAGFALALLLLAVFTGAATINPAP